MIQSPESKTTSASFVQCALAAQLASLSWSAFRLSRAKFPRLHFFIPSDKNPPFCLWLQLFNEPAIILASILQDLVVIALRKIYRDLPQLPLSSSHLPPHYPPPPLLCLLLPQSHLRGALPAAAFCPIDGLLPRRRFPGAVLDSADILGKTLAGVI